MQSQASAVAFDAGARFEIVQLLGEGSYGAVYEALEARTRERVALKMLRHTHPTALSAFKQEFRALTEVHHVNLVSLRELYEYERRWVIVMDLVEGVDLMAWVRPTQIPGESLPHGFDEKRLRTAFMDMAEGLHALHQVGLLHRDVKPTNVRVTHAGRAVLLDFGLVTTVAPDAQSTGQIGPGSARYMAPEQALGVALTPAADWYAYGTCLYEALTGSPPFGGGEPVSVLFRKSHEKPRAACDVRAGLPVDLNELCMGLLERSAELRPSFTDIQRALDGGPRKPRTLAHSLRPVADPSPIFQGRENELEVLDQALLRTHEGDLSVVLIEGESGVGKSELLRVFLSRKRGREPQTMVLPGRCYQNECVSYKAFDGCIDALASLLRAVSCDTRRPLLPPRSSLLGELFPVLRGLHTDAAGEPTSVAANPAARRQEAFETLAELLGRLAVLGPLVLVIDDLQWADAESFHLLRALVEHRPSPALLIACTVRPRAELPVDVEERISVVRSYPNTRTLALRGLPSQHAHALAVRLLAADVRPALAKRIAVESMGHPMLMAELARYAARSDPAAIGELSLAAALAARVAALDPTSRALLEAVALCGRPCSQALLQAALGLETLGDALTRLLADRLLVRQAGGDLSSFHSATRDAVLSAMSAEQKQQLHGSLAHALASTGEGDAGELCVHWDLAGQTGRALSAYTMAADQALTLLAFTRAAQLYARAIELRGGVSDAAGAALLVRRAQALACSGRSAEAATLYLEAAEHVTGNERTRLRVWAAQHQIQSAQVDAGMQNARAVLDELRLPLPRAALASLARIVWERARVAMHGLKVAPPARDMAPDDRLALDAMAGLILPVTWVELLPGSALNMHHLRRALSVGEPGHAARALGQEAAFRAMQQPNETAAYLPLLARGKQLADSTGDPVIQAHVAFMGATVDLLRSEFRSARRGLETALDTIVTRCPGEQWLLSSVRMNMGMILWHLGDHARLASDTEAWRRDALQRRDAFAEAALAGLGFGFVATLMRDAPTEASDRLRRAMEGWPPRSFGFAHHGELHAVVATSAYEGSDHGLRWLSQRTAVHDRAFPHRTAALRDRVVFARCLAGLSACLTKPADARAPLLLAIERELGRSTRRGVLSVVEARLVEAQLHVLRGRSESAHAAARLAREGAQQSGLRTYALSAGYLEGLLSGTAAGRERGDEATSYYHGQGWQDPWRGATLYIPAARIIEADAGLKRPSRHQLVHGRYRLGPSLAPGALGGVVEAYDTRTGRTLALKSLAEARPTDLARFKQEFRALQGVHHENLARLEALFEHAGEWTIAMERVHGVDLLAFVRPGDELDEERLRSALSGLLRGADALHEAGFVHRDLKPQHVRVNEAGRVVLVDFGLMTHLDASQRDSAEAAVGSVAYVAPEQIDRPDFDASSDVYSIGICLYQALTGRLPFDHLTRDRVLDAKRRGRAVPPSALGLQVPTDLEELCLAMLEREPGRRPTVAQALARVEGQYASGKGGSARPRAPYPQGLKAADERFAGRSDELCALDALFDRAAQGAAVLAVVQGESGIGKTAVVSEALRRIHMRGAHLMPLRSRCYANEQTAYQVFDSAVDELSRALRKLPRSECTALLPPRAALLTQLFPALGSVAAIREASKKGLSAEPAWRRREALTAFVALLVTLSQRIPLVLAIDDIQWADVESVHLLETLLRDATGARLAIVATRRLREARDPPVEEALNRLATATETTVLTLKRLSDADAEALLSNLLGAQATPTSVAIMVREGGGHPLLLRELAAYAAQGSDLLLGGTFDLDQALTTRFERLTIDARRLLTLVALTGRPCASSMFERAFGSRVAFDDALRQLLGEELVRMRSGGTLVCFHDWVRELAVRLVPAERQAEVYAQLAEALQEEPDSDPAEWARLWDRAGNPAKAANAYAQAGSRAMDVLAFSRADRLIARALELKGDVRDEERLALLVLRAHALARAGKSAAAALLYEETASLAQGEDGVRLRVATARHQIQSAQIERGMQHARAVLHELGLPLPRGRAASLSRIFWERARVSLRGVKVHKATPPTAEDRLALDTMAGLILPVSWVEVLPGAALNVFHLRRALDVGEPGHVARALSQEAAFLAMQNPDGEAAYLPLLERSRALADETCDPAIQAQVAMMEGQAHSTHNDLAYAAQRLEVAQDLIVTRCPGEQWLLTSVRMTLGSVWFNLGDHARLKHETDIWSADAVERGDVFATAALVGVGRGYVAPLMHDAPEIAEEGVTRAMEAWPPRSFGYAHHGELQARAWIAAYQGSADGRRWLSERTRDHDRAFPQRALRDSLYLSRCVAGLASLATEDPRHQPALQGDIEADLRQISRTGSSLGACLGALVAAQLEALRDSERAPILLREAQRRLVEHGLGAFAGAALYLVGMLEGGDSGAANRDACLCFFRDQGWVNPLQAVHMLVPAVRVIAQRR